MKVLILLGFLVLGVFFFVLQVAVPATQKPFWKKGPDMAHSQEALKPDPWKEKLTPEQYAILREGGTETPYTSELLNEKRAGTYYSADTREAVFRSEDKYESNTGWPSFKKPISPEAVAEKEDLSYGMTRTEVVSTAGGHLGHIFTDGPEPLGLRYCINGDALYFVPDEETKE